MTIQSETATRSIADSRAARRAMIDSQLRTSGVNEEFALARMMAVPREAYLPAEKSPLAYIDRSIRLDGGAHLAAPLFYGKLLIEAEPSEDDKVLIIEGGTGYLADLLRPLVGPIDTVSAEDAAKGQFSADGNYSLVLIDGAIEELPQAVSDAIEENGRIAGGLLLRGVTRLASGRKVAGQVAFLPVEDLGIPILHAFDKPKGWSF